MAAAAATEVYQAQLREEAQVAEAAAETTQADQAVGKAHGSAIRSSASLNLARSYLQQAIAAGTELHVQQAVLGCGAGGTGAAEGGGAEGKAGLAPGGDAKADVFILLLVRCALPPLHSQVAIALCVCCWHGRWMEPEKGLMIPQSGAERCAEPHRAPGLCRTSSCAAWWATPRASSRCWREPRRCRPSAPTTLPWPQPWHVLARAPETAAARWVPGRDIGSLGAHLADAWRFCGRLRLPAWTA